MTKSRYSGYNIDVLAEYLAQKEVETIMFKLLDQEKALAFALADAQAEGEARGEARGKANGERTALLRSLRAIMTRLKVSAEEAMDIIGIPEEERNTYLVLLSSK